MRDKLYYTLAVSLLLAAVVALVAVFGENQRASAQPASAQSAASLQGLFSTLSDRINSDSAFIFRIRVNGSAGPASVTLGQSAAKITDVGSDYFCASKAPPVKSCYPFAQILAIGLPG